MEGQNHQDTTYGNYAQDREAAWCSTSAWGGARRTQGVPGTIRRHFADRRLCRLCGVGGPKIGACLLLGARAKESSSRQAKLNPTISLPRRIVAADSTGLFGIDAQARELNLDHAARHALRLERAKPLLEIIRGEVKAARDASLPFQRVGEGGELYTLALAEAYALPGVSRVGAEQTTWRRTRCARCLWVRKNWIHVGSQQAAPKCGGHLVSIVESCRRLKIPIKNIWLASYPPLWADRSVQRRAN